MSFGRALVGAVAAEALKLRRTLALRMTAVAPAVVVTLCVVQFGFAGSRLHQPDGPAAWRAFAGATFALWSFLMMPLLVTLEAALLAGLEHGERQWKHLLALPVPRAVHYLAKWIALVALLLLTVVTFTAFIVLGGEVIARLAPMIGIAGSPPWWWLLRSCLGMVAAALLMAAIQLWVAVRWSSFTVAVAVGTCALVVGFEIGQSRYGHLFPWSLPVQLFLKNGRPAFALAASGIGGPRAGGVAPGLCAARARLSAEAQRRAQRASASA